MQSTSFTGNTNANGQGGAIAITAGSTARLTNVTLLDNQAARGAGIYAANSSLTLTGTTLNTNSARNTGVCGPATPAALAERSLCLSCYLANLCYTARAAQIQLPSVTISRPVCIPAEPGSSLATIWTQLDKNTACAAQTQSSLIPAHAGGGLYAAAGPVNITNSTFTGNSAGQSGGGIATGALGVLDMYQSEERCHAALCIMLDLSRMPAGSSCSDALVSQSAPLAFACLQPSLFVFLPQPLCCQQGLAVLRGHGWHFNIEQRPNSHLHSFRALLQTSVDQTLGYA